MDHHGGDIKCVAAASFHVCDEICLSEPQCRRWSFASSPSRRGIDGEKLDRVEKGACILKKGQTGIHDGNPFLAHCSVFSGFKNIDSKLCDDNGTTNKTYFWNYQIMPF